ncbi:hypothetical protein QVD17_04839 [Tagetes erecta]|uniref:Uncharacterized protein n=1 Tax=Tagetes erecta TaxID=13708 RepID=A0AAD8PAP6_TARER|nr:hypothetical protein QVD17_04839 [Tagetes erecta]
MIRHRTSTRRKWRLQVRYPLYACIILHKMILEDDGNAICQNYIPDQVEEEIIQATFEERVANDAPNSTKATEITDKYCSNNFKYKCKQNLSRLQYLIFNQLFQYNLSSILCHTIQSLHLDIKL